MDVQFLEPVSSTAGLKDRLAAYIATLVAAPYVACKLFKTNVTITQQTTLDNLVEADYAGYAPSVVTTYQSTYIDPAGFAWATTPLQNFVCAGGGTANTIYSAGLVQSTGSAATATGTQSGGAVNAITVTAGGTGYLLPPRVTITDATVGVGATAHAVLTAGVVTSIVIDTGGSGYTGPVIALERPVRLIAGKSFNSGQIMALSTDAVQVIMQINQNQ